MKRIVAVCLICVLCLISVVSTGAFEGTAVNEEDRITITFDDEYSFEDAVEEYADLNGKDVKLSLDGEPRDILGFLDSMSFRTLDLEILSGYTGYFYDEYRLSDVDSLVKLVIYDSSNPNFSREDVFQNLEDLTLIYNTNSSRVFGRINSRQMPSLRHLQLDFSEEYFEGHYLNAVLLNSSQWYQLPNSLETLDITIGGIPVPAEDLIPDNYSEKALANLFGILLCYCPSVSVNGMNLLELPAIQNKLVNLDLISRDAAAAYACGIYDGIQYGDRSGMVSGFPDPVYGKLMFAEFDDTYGLDCLSIDDLDDPALYRDGAVPEERLAAGLEEADMLILLYDKNISVGFYIPSGTAYQVDTMMAAVDLNTGTVYAPYTVASNDPPNTITVQTINGVPMGGSGYGDYEPEKAIDLLMEAYREDIPGKAEGGFSEQTEDAAADTQEPSDPAMLPEEPLQEDASDEAFLQEVLSALNDSAYDNTLASLKQGNVISQGTYSETAKGLQKTLTDFGCDISIDGSAGPGTFAALNQVLSAFHMESADMVDAALYEKLLPLLLISKDEDGEYSELLQSHYQEGENSSEYLYLKGCAYYASQHYYKALEAFEESQYQDYEERMASCEQSWPSNGELWHNSAYYSSSMDLTFQVNQHGEGEGMCFVVYTADHVPVSELFITGNGSVTTSLPGGVYRIKDATGYNWYGLRDTFGRNGYYEFMTFYEDDDDPYLTWLDAGYEWTITVNVTEGNPDATGVGSVYSDWESWAE